MFKIAGTVAVSIRAALEFHFGLCYFEQAKLLSVEKMRMIR